MSEKKANRVRLDRFVIRINYHTGQTEWLTVIFIRFHKKPNLSVVVNVANVDGPVRVRDEDDLNQNFNKIKIDPK